MSLTELNSVCSLKDRSEHFYTHGSRRHSLSCWPSLLIRRHPQTDSITTACLLTWRRDNDLLGDWFPQHGHRDHRNLPVWSRTYPFVSDDTSDEHEDPEQTNVTTHRMDKEPWWHSFWCDTYRRTGQRWRTFLKWIQIDRWSSLGLLLKVRWINQPVILWDIELTVQPSRECHWTKLISHHYCHLTYFSFQSYRYQSTMNMNENAL